MKSKNEVIGALRWLDGELENFKQTLTCPPPSRSAKWFMSRKAQQTIGQMEQEAKQHAHICTPRVKGMQEALRFVLSDRRGLRVCPLCPMKGRKDEE